MNAGSYSQIASALIKMGHLRDMGLVPIISNPPQHVDSFEEFAYEFYKSNTFYKMAKSNNSSSSSSNNATSNAVFTGGIYSYSSRTGEKYHDTNGSTTFSKYTILTPLLEVFDRRSIGAVMYNLHSEYHRGRAMDRVIDAWNANIRNRTAVTPMVQLVEDNMDKGPPPPQRPAAVLFHPISPARSRSELVGFIRAVHHWDTVLQQAVVPTHCCKAMQIVVSDGMQLATYLCRFKRLCCQVHRVG